MLLLGKIQGTLSPVPMYMERKMYMGEKSA